LANHKTETTLGKVNLRTAEQLADDHIRELVDQQYQRLIEAKQSLIDTLVETAKNSANAADYAREAAVNAAVAAEKASTAALLAAEKASTAAAVAAEKAATAAAVAAGLIADHNSERLTQLENQMAQLQSTMDRVAALLESVQPPVPPEVTEALTIVRKHRKRAVSDDCPDTTI
jgi:septation ring formation regulator EzrA